MLASELRAMLGNGQLSRIFDFVKTFNAVDDDYGFSPICGSDGDKIRRRLRYFVAQVAHESAGLAYTKELASGKAYEGRRDLGNVKAGDGVRFKGRGYIQITGRANYTALGKDLGIDCVNHPEMLEQPHWALMSALWFWKTKHLNKYADKDDFTGLTRAINGGTNGMADRLAWLKKANHTIYTL